MTRGDVNLLELGGDEGGPTLVVDMCAAPGWSHQGPAVRICTGNDQVFVEANYLPDLIGVLERAADAYEDAR